MFLDKKTEDLWIKYLNPSEVIFPSEIHELARGLLDAYREAILNSENLIGELTLLDFIAKMVERYGKYVERYAKKYKIVESPEIFNWWDRVVSTISVEGVLLSLGWGHGAPAVKLFLVAIYFTKRFWDKRMFRKALNSLEDYLRHESEKSIIGYGVWLRKTQKIGKFREKVWGKVWSSSPEVDELAELLIEAREKIYWKSSIHD